MKKKIVINVPMHSQRAKSKAMRIAVNIQGVTSVKIGEKIDQLEVIGEAVDSVCLANSLRKKFCFAQIITIEEVKPPKPPSPAKPCHLPPPPLYCQFREYDSHPYCSIM